MEAGQGKKGGSARVVDACARARTFGSFDAPASFAACPESEGALTDLPRPGASYLGGGRCHFSVWVPNQRSVEVVLLGAGDGGATRVVSLEPLTFGHHAGIVERVAPGQWYKIRIGGVDFPDLASRSQPEGVHGASGNHRSRL